MSDGISSVAGSPERQTRSYWMQQTNVARILMTQGVWKGEVPRIFKETQSPDQKGETHDLKTPSQEFEIQVTEPTIDTPIIPATQAQDSTKGLTGTNTQLATPTPILYQGETKTPTEFYSPTLIHSPTPTLTSNPNPNPTETDFPSLTPTPTQEELR